MKTNDVNHKTNGPLEKQLEDIQSKAALHRLVDEIDETESIAILLSMKPCGCLAYRTFGSPPAERILWMTRDFEHSLMHGDFEVE